MNYRIVDIRNYRLYLQIGVRMIRIILSDRAYDNDVYQIVKAFYPKKEIEISSVLSDTPKICVDLKDNKDINDKKDYKDNKGYKGYKGYKEYKEYIDDKDIKGIKGNKGHERLLDIDEINDLQDDVLVSQIIMIFESNNISQDKSHHIGIEITDNSGRKYESYITTPDPIKEKPIYKNAMKRQLYKMLSSLSKNELPWGILTGIRPTKIIYDMLEEGMNEKEVYESMENEFLCSKEKLDLSIGIAQREKELLNEIDYKNGYSLYIGIPFCPSTCLYCSFTSFSLEKFGGKVDDYLNALEKEIKFATSCFPNKKLTTVYIGGGTPTTLSVEQLDRLLGLIRLHYDFTYVREFCVEAGRPDSITKEKLEVLKKWGVDRISINPQTMQQRTLDLIGRRHTVEQITQTFDLARQVGHNNINMDIIIGLPGETPDDVKDTLEKIKILNPDSLTVHTLALKRAARLNTEKEIYKGLEAKDVPEMLKVSMDFAKENDYIPYYLYRQKNMADNLENIGYSRYGKEGLYNILIMEEKQTILALGAGAYTKAVYPDGRIERCENVKDVNNYIARIDEMIERKRSFFKDFDF